MRDVQTKDPTNTMHQSLPEKAAEAPTDTLADSLAQFKADVKGASLF